MPGIVKLLSWFPVAKIAILGRGSGICNQEDRKKFFCVYNPIVKHLIYINPRTQQITIRL